MDMNKKTKIRWAFLSWFSNPVINLSTWLPTEVSSQFTMKMPPLFKQSMRLSWSKSTSVHSQQARSQFYDKQSYAVSHEGPNQQPSNHLPQYMWIDWEENRIENVGCRCLTRADWPQLKHIDLSKSSITQLPTASRMLGSSTSPRQNGPISST